MINKEYDVPYKIDSNIHYLEILNLLREGSKTILDLISQMQFFYEVPQYEEKYKDSIQANIEIISVFKENINTLDFSDLKKLENNIQNMFSNTFSKKKNHFFIPYHIIEYNYFSLYFFAVYSNYKLVNYNKFIFIHFGY